MYEGEFRNGKANGPGWLITKYGDVCKGEFKNNIAHGQCKILYSRQQYIGH